MRYFMYSRKSSDGEDRQVESIGDQTADLHRLAASCHLTVFEELKESHSAKIPGGRPVFNEMLERIRQGEADGILCWSLNRLFRNAVDYGQVSWLLQQGVIKAVRTMEREYLPEDNVLLMAVEAGVATQFVIDLGRAVKRSMAGKASRGWLPGKAPLGYRNNRDTKEIDADPETFDLLRRAWELMLTGCYTVPQMRKWLRSSGFPDTARSNVYHIFDNPFYYGEFRYKGELFQGRHQPMVTRNEFDRVQAIIHKRNYIQPQKHEFAFTGLMRCGICGCAITAERRVKNYKTTGNTRTYTYYHCTGSKGCSTAGVREEYIELKIAELLGGCRIDAGFLPVADQMIERWSSSHSRSLEQQEQRLKLTLRTLTTRSERLLDLRLARELDSEEFLLQKQRIQLEVARIQNELNRLSSKSDRDKVTFENLLRFATRSHSVFTDASVGTKRAIALALSDRYLLTLGELSIEAHPLLERIRTFEPWKCQALQVKTTTDEPISLIEYPLLDSIRTLITEGDYSFLRIPLEDLPSVPLNKEMREKKGSRITESYLEMG